MKIINEDSVNKWQRHEFAIPIVQCARVNCVCVWAYFYCSYRKELQLLLTLLHVHVLLSLDCLVQLFETSKCAYAQNGYININIFADCIVCVTIVDQKEQQQQ